MKKVLAFGTFDILHPGHCFYLTNAKRYGDNLTVVVARDQTVEKVKGQLPQNNEETRLKTIQSLPYVDVVLLGSLDDPISPILNIKPDIICLGYDQDSFTQGLKDKLSKMGLSPRIIRMKPHKPKKYKSSLLKVESKG